MKAAALVRSLRKVSKLTQLQFGHEVGVHWKTVQAWELGTREPMWRHVEAMLSLTGITLKLVKKK